MGIDLLAIFLYSRPFSVRKMGTSRPFPPFRRSMRAFSSSVFRIRVGLLACMPRLGPILVGLMPFFPMFSKMNALETERPRARANSLYILEMLNQEVRIWKSMASA